MESLLAPGPDGNYQTYFGHARDGLFVHRVEGERYLFRHQGSGHSLFFFTGEPAEAQRLLLELSLRYDFSLDSAWVLKGLSEIHSQLSNLGLARTWLYRAWHYSYPR